MNIFDQIQIRRPKASIFDLSHERKFTCNMGDLVPILCEEILPGDKWKMNSEVFMRLMPLISPVMHRVNVYTHFFFVPYRLIWDNYQKFITGGEDGSQNAVIPYIQLTEDSTYLNPGSLADYLGVSVYDQSEGNTIKINSLAFRAYQLIYNEYYRDQTLNPAVPFGKGDGAEITPLNSLMAVRKRAWEKDYFTSALPWTQRSTNEVQLPLAGQAPVLYDDSTTSRQTYRLNSDNSVVVDSLYSGPSGLASSGNPTHIDPEGTLVADLSGVSATSVNQLRAALRLQEWFEKNARAGSRYIEQILSHFGVRVPDHRLQRPEYLGGGKSPIVISEVLQTSQSDTTPQGNLAGHGMSVGNTHSWNRMFQEHGFVIGIMSTLPRTSYQQGTRRHFFKETRYELAWPEFANLGEQELYQGELACQGGHEKDTFGYQARYSEYKFIPSSVHGQMKESLEFWHMGRIFETPPVLNGEFVSSSPTHRVFAVTDPNEHKLIVQIFNSIKAIRPLPYFGSPSII